MNLYAEGFAGQRLFRLPEELTAQARNLPVCRDLLPTDLGHFPETALHEVRRPNATSRHILILCVSGEGWVKTDGKRRRSVPPRSLIVIPAGTPHAYGASANNPWRLYWVHFEGERADDYLQLVQSGNQSPVRELSNIEELCEGFETLWRLRDEGGSEPGLLRMSAELSRLLILLHTRVRRTGETAHHSEERVERALHRMREGLAEDLHLPDFAQAAGVSVPHFCALFKTDTGVPPMTYFMRLRMRHAAEWLDGTGESVAAIARRVGYENPFHFSRAFRRTHGLSPRAFRQRIRG